MNKIFARIILIIFSLFAKLGRFLQKKSRLLKKPVILVSNFFNGFIFFPLYKVLYILKHKILNIYAPAKSKVFYFLNKSYLLHIFIIIIGSTIVLNNISAQELRSETFGKQTVIYSIITKEDYEELTEEKLAQSAPSRILGFLESTSTSDTQKSISDQPVENQMVTEITTITEGGSALVKPNIMQPVEAEEIPELQSPSRDEVINYVVAGGETVSAIASKFGISVETILWENGLGPRSLIRPGDTLRILPVTGVTHKIKSGDTLSAIAKKYDVDSDEIIAYNNLFDKSDIKVNQNLIIPGGKKVSPYVSTSTYATRSNPQVSSITKLFIPPSSTVSGSGLLWPTSVRRISQYYSWRHTGLDIAGPTGTPLYASDDGVVELSGWSTGYGNNIIINHGNGTKTRYAHASKLYVAVGDTVVRGQTIAAMGSTGWSTGPHIHFEVIVGGGKKNPLSYIQ